MLPLQLAELKYNEVMRILDAVNRWLPPPEILQIGGLGVDVSESSIKYIGFEPSHLGIFSLRLNQFGEVPIEPGVLEKGEITDVKKFGAALAAVRRRTNNSYMRVSLPEERAYVFETEIDAGLSRKAIRQQLEFKMEENVPLSPRDSYFDFKISTQSTAGQCMATVTVCPKSFVDTYYEACRLAKVTPLSFEVESEAIARAVLPNDDKGTRMLLDFGRTRSGLGIVHQGRLLYTSTIDVGGDAMSVSLRKSLGEKPESELTKLKNEVGLVQSTENKQVFEALLPVMSLVKDEVQVRIQYWNDKNGQLRPLDQIIICGGSANMRGLTSYLSETLNIETVLADVWQNAFDSKLLTPPIDRRHSYGYATAVGLGLASFLRKV